ncbi:sensor histidine kinase [Tropheryma whipplei]|uniref:histidine kinase n=1 Tax=Tropheryma whipplei (strain Twist) TaxID=203267 RepID=Q83H17_TROWT|nr:HAMP domain-containing sensor histidine kinase [Tropheryma whipplei]AAO44143.1 two-component system sensor histidine kinase [Tropheryma whipplei str. Twist]MCO8182666.1 HAMP domain-containing histidine kinase [Tropheryma whipplei]MCO8190362.1 HAMP domain-containing histidine kinase [Tropheryma whipplei]
MSAKFPSKLYRLVARSSIKSKVVTLVALVLAFSFTAVGIGTTLVIKNEMIKTIDEQLIHISGTFPLFESSFEVFSPGRASYKAHIYKFDGTLIWPIGENPSIEFDRKIDITLYNEKGNTPFTLHSISRQKKYRMLLQPLETGSGQEILAYYLPQSGTENTANFYQRSYIWFSLAVFAIAAYIVYLITAHTLSPLYALEKTARAFARGDYSRRIRSEYVSAEILNLNKSLNSMLDSLEKALGERDKTLGEMKQFLADASHELRTPLVSLRGYAELYRIGALKGKEDIDNAIERIEKEAIRMGTMVEDLLSLTRLEKATDLVPVDVKYLVQESVIDMNVLEKTRKITTGIPKRQSCMILGNENMLRRLLANLINNALHYTPPGSPIEIVLRTDKTDVVIDVRDHGPGVPRQLHDKVFKRFWRSDASRARNSGGVGLGLSIVASIVKVHKGTIEILRTRGGGATFRTRIPKLVNKHRSGSSSHSLTR